MKLKVEPATRREFKAKGLQVLRVIPEHRREQMPHSSTLRGLAERDGAAVIPDPSGELLKVQVLLKLPRRREQFYTIEQIDRL